MREYFEDLEYKILAGYAIKSRNSRGREYPESDSVNRTCFQRDRDRIIHSKAFRRLKHKAQVFIATESDHYRSRLVHTLEVAQLSRHLARLLMVNEDLTESIALAHDLGHTPFGHCGERILNKLMKDQGGFEHNLQSLRVVDELEKKYPGFPGLNLSYEVRHGLIKHINSWTGAEKKPLSTTIEAQICNIADEIAYNSHDLNDGLASGILREEDIRKHVVIWKDAEKEIKSRYVNTKNLQLKRLIHSLLINMQINDVFKKTKENLKKFNIETLEDIQYFEKNIVAFSLEMSEKIKDLRKYLYNNFYTSSSVYRMNKKGQDIICSLFEAFTNDEKLLPVDYRTVIGKGVSRERVCCDYIAGMTDTYAQQEYSTIFS